MSESATSRAPLLLLLAVNLVTGCGSNAPAEPTYFADVQPLLRANCVRCHGASGYQGRPGLRRFRLDRYVDDYVPDLQQSASNDAYEYHWNIVRHAVDHASPAMPPEYALSERQKELLRRWVEACPPPDGGALPDRRCAPKGERDNRLPEVEVFAPSPSDVIDQVLQLDFRAWDADADGLVVAVGYRRIDGDGEEGLLASNLGGGRQSLSLDTGVLASKGRFDVFAWLDDGYFDLYDRDTEQALPVTLNRTEVSLLGGILVDHGDRGTAPSIRLLEPNGGGTLLGETPIVWSATDADPGETAALRISLELLRVTLDGNGAVVDEQVDRVIASDLVNDPAQFPPWSVAGVPATDSRGQPLHYRIRATASDGKNTRSDASDDTFTLAATSGQTSYTWDDVKPLFLTYCASCHGQPARQPSLEVFRLDKYNAADPEAPTNADPGVYEMRTQVYERLVVTGSMPPASEPQPSAAEVSRIADWILGGAPQSAGPVDGKPTFVWDEPLSDVKTTSNQVTLRWHTADPEGQPFQAAQLSYVRIPSGTLPGSAVCPAGQTGWSSITSDVTTVTGPPQPRSLAWTVPAHGCYCLKGDVTDAASQSTAVVAPGLVIYRMTLSGSPQCP